MKKILELPYQTQFYQGIRVYRISIMFAGRQLGKTFTSLHSVFRLMLESKQKWTIISLTEELTKQRIKDFEEIVYYYEMRFGIRVRKSVNVTSAELINGSEIVAATSAIVSKRGYTTNLLLDEICFFPDKEELWDTVSPAALVSGNKVIAISSYPNSGTDFFTDFYDKVPDDPNLRDKVFRMPEISIIEAVSQGLVDKNGFPIDTDFLRSTVSQNTWDREYACKRVARTGVVFNMDRDFQVYDFSPSSTPLQAVILSVVPRSDKLEGFSAAVVLGLTQNKKVIVLDWDARLSDKSYLTEHVIPSYTELLAEYENFVGTVFQCNAVGTQFANDMRATGRTASVIPEVYLGMNLDDKINLHGDFFKSGSVLYSKRAKTKTVNLNDKIYNPFTAQHRDYMFKERSFCELVEANLNGIIALGVR